MSKTAKVICVIVYGGMCAALLFIASLDVYKAHGADLNTTINIPATIQGYNTLDVLNYAATLYGKSLAGGSVGTNTLTSDQLKAQYENTHAIPLITDKRFFNGVSYSMLSYTQAVQKYFSDEKVYINAHLVI